jgi:hypothetical protein
VVTGREIVTTAEELDGFNIVRAIAVSEVVPERIFLRDGKIYCAILLDNNNRKPLIRLYLHGKTVKFVTTFENGKTGTRHDIKTVVDIYKVHVNRFVRRSAITRAAARFPNLKPTDDGMTEPSPLLS